MEHIVISLLLIQICCMSVWLIVTFSPAVNKLDKCMDKYLEGK